MCCERVLKLLMLVWLWVAGQAAWAQEKVNYDNWRLEWAEEFNEPLDTVALSARWQFHYPWGRALLSPIETGYYTGKELQTANGTLNLTMHKLAQPIVYRGKELRYTTGMLFSRHFNDSLRPTSCDPASEGFSYGLFEVRARQPRTQGTAPGFWLYGGAPDEIDAFEADPTTTTNNFHLAPGGYWRPTRQQEIGCQCAFYNVDPAGDLSAQFHTYGVSWLPDGVIFYFDGIPIRHETRLMPAGCPMNIILNIAALKWANAPTDTLSVDYIRVYRPRQLPTLPPALRQGAYAPTSELTWLPAEAQPGRFDPTVYQTWQLAPQPRRPNQLGLLLTDNHNPACDLSLPLPVDGTWAPHWMQTYGVPELRVHIAAPDSVHWSLLNAKGEAVARGVAAGGGTWYPSWGDLPPGAYSLHLQQGTAAMAQLVVLTGRPAGSAPDSAWQQPATLPPDAE